MYNKKIIILMITGIVTIGSTVVYALETNYTNSSVISCTKSYNDSTYTAIESMIAQSHEGVPNGAPIDWKYKPRIENLYKPYGWNALTQWGQIYLEEGYEYPQNTAIEISNFKIYGYSQYDGEWKLIKHSMPGDVFYREDYNGDMHTTLPNKIKKDYENKKLTVKLDKETVGYNLHPFSQQINISDSSIYDLQYIMFRMDVRLVKWDENAIDDRDAARYVANVGGDWWRNVGDVWQPDWSTNVGIGQGQFRTITKDIKSCFMTNKLY